MRKYSIAVLGVALCLTVAARLLLPYDVLVTVAPSLAASGARFSRALIPSLFGKVAIVTGGSSGLGKETARELALAGATVVIGCRSRQRCSAARDEIAHALGEKGPGSGMVWAMDLDLASLASVAAFADSFRASFKRLDILVNNGGIMASPVVAETADGLESHFGVNHIGHHALTKHLLDMLVASQPSRIVTVSSSAHRFVPPGGLLAPELLDRRRPGSSRNGGAALSLESGGGLLTLGGTGLADPWLYYGHSKLCNILFTKALARRLSAHRVEGKASLS